MSLQSASSPPILRIIFATYFTQLLLYLFFKCLSSLGLCSYYSLSHLSCGFNLYLYADGLSFVFSAQFSYLGSSPTYTIAIQLDVLQASQIQHIQK